MPWSDEHLTSEFTKSYKYASLARYFFSVVVCVDLQSRRATRRVKIDKEKSMKRQAKSDRKCVKSVKICASGLLMLSGVLLILTWPAVFDCILFKVSWTSDIVICENCCVINAKRRKRMLTRGFREFSRNRLELELVFVALSRAVNMTTWDKLSHSDSFRISCLQNQLHQNQKNNYRVHKNSATLSHINCST